MRARVARAHAFDRVTGVDLVVALHSADSTTWVSSCMAHRSRRAGRTSLGMLSGRLRGGFSASPLPRNVTATSSDRWLESTGTPPSRPQSPFYTSGSGNQTEGSLSSPSSSSSISVSEQSVHTSMTTTLQIVLETVRKMDRKVTNVEQKQVQLAENMKELNVLLKKQERDNFSIKGSTWEVRKNSSKHCFRAVVNINFLS